MSYDMCWDLYVLCISDSFSKGARYDEPTRTDAARGRAPWLLYHPLASCRIVNILWPHGTDQWPNHR
jgi:hypothetical protein